MTAVLYLLIAILVFFIVGYFLARIGCGSEERYLSETPVDPVTEDSGSCEDPEILAVQKKHREAAEAEAQRIRDEAAKADADAKIRAEEEAKRKAAEKAAAEKALEEKAAKEKNKDTSAAKEKSKIEESDPQVQTVKAEAAKEEGTDKQVAKKQVETKVTEKSIVALDDRSSDAGNAPEPETAEVSVPEGLLDAPRGGKKDNLTRIKGIGIKIDKALNRIGIWHFDQIAVWTEENMAWADRELAFPGRAKRDDWVGQAKLLAKGKETEFSKRVDKGEVASSKKA